MNFRQFLETSKKQRKERLQSLLDNEELCLFFQLASEFFAAPEDSRLVFARMKSPEDDDKDWVKDANFVAINVNKAADGEDNQKVFSSLDLPKIKIISKEDLLKLMA